jgi:hypothetical protein
VTVLPRYPIFVPSKGRSANCLTAKFLDRDGVPFCLVVEPQEATSYEAAWGKNRVLVLPFKNLGLGSIPARNWIKDYSVARGDKRHWQLDDNIRKMWRRVDGIKFPCEAGPALAAAEDFADRYENVALAGMNYTFFAPNRDEMPPFYANVHVYSCTLVLNAIPHRWRGRYNEDTDLCLQVLSDGWCTVLLNAFLCEKMVTMTMGGGNTAELYRGDGRLKMARALERLWPGVVETHRRFKRPQHVIKGAWKWFDTPLRLRKGLSLARMKKNDYGLHLVQKKQEVKSPLVRAMLEKHG